MLKNGVREIIKATTNILFLFLALYYTTIKKRWPASSFCIFDDFGGLFVIL
jgi:hypothetical protein